MANFKIISVAVVCNVLCHRQQIQVASHGYVRATSVKTVDRYRNCDLLPTHTFCLCLWRTKPMWLDSWMSFEENRYKTFLSFFILRINKLANPYLNERKNDADKLWTQHERWKWSFCHCRTCLILFIEPLCANSIMLQWLLIAHNTTNLSIIP